MLVVDHSDEFGDPAIRIAVTHFNSRISYVSLHESREILRKILRLSNDMVFFNFVWYGICEVECTASHVDAADAGLPSLYGGQLGYISLATGPGEANFACTVLKFTLRSRTSMSYGMHAIRMRDAPIELNTNPLYHTS